MERKPTAREGDSASSAPATSTLDITVLMGGPSNEREVSLMSGGAIADGLIRAGHKVTTADISPNDTSALDRIGADLVFIALHGEFGESGEVQELCERRGLPYTGSPPRASKLAMDKAAAKQIFKRCDLATPEWMIIEEYHAPEKVRGWLPELGVPVVVKPVCGGSSVDVTVARTESQRDELIGEMMDRYGRVMLEGYVPGRELTVGILGSDPLPLLEVIPAREFYDFTAKYADGSGTQYVFDHGLGERLVQTTQAAAIKAHDCLGCRDMSRVDFMLGEDGEPQILEVNTIPGFTSHSLLPMAARQAGVSFPELVDRIATLAMQR